ncbi:hypothetical protein HDV03_000869, partial [Kappamyces sp. JEL0829]
MSAFNLSSLPADLKGKNALVTGGSRGIGHAISLKLASLGANIVVNYSSNQAAAEATVAEIKKHGVKAFAVKADVSKSSEASALVAEAVKQFGKLDVLVNNSGIFLASLVHESSDELYRQIVGVNVDGVFFVTRAAVNNFNDGGAIITISSVVSKKAFPGISVYTLSKGAIEAFGRALAVELAPRRIRVNTVSPGYTDTEPLRSGGEALAKQAAEASLFKRLGVPEDIAEA